VCQGAQPLFFLDYVSIGKLDPDQIEQLVAGIAAGCKQAGCALIGGEMAEHPGVMAPGEFDLVGFAVGAAERDALITGAAVTPGDVLLGLPSPNLRSNGFSLARRVLFEVAGRHLDDPAWDGATTSVADELLDPSVIYAPAVLDVVRTTEVHAVAHITGGGLPGNLVRVLAPGTEAVVDAGAWEAPRFFGEIQRLGAIDLDEMRRVFNCGIGMVLVVPADHTATATAVLATHGHRAVVIGEVAAAAGDDRVVRYA
jgi:phosphoribosylformylglycinamidine cyclo-ligase